MPRCMGTWPRRPYKILLAKSYTPHTYIGVSYDKSACPGHSGHFASSIQKGGAPEGAGTESAFIFPIRAVGGTSNGHVVKHIRFIGKAAHAGGAPHEGINALQAAMVALNALNTQRETLRNEDAIRLHGILTKGGAAVNSIPADVRYEGRVRGRSLEAITDANLKMDRCLKAGALALGAKVHIVTIPGYLPMQNNALLMDLFKSNAAHMVGA